MFRKLMYNRSTKEKGQTVVLVALMMVAMIGLAALAIDLSNVFVQRRNMQNGADAGALAGARMLALYAADPQLNYRHRDVYYEVLRAAQANGADDIEAYLISWADGQKYRQLQPNDYSALPRCRCACGVWVKAETEFGTFLSQLFGINMLTASAEAQAQFGEVTQMTGIAPIALHKDEVGMGRTIRIWDSVKDAGADRGWLGLDCKYPDKSSDCSPDSNSLKQWIQWPFYQGSFDLVNQPFYGGDPGVRNSVLQLAKLKGEASEQEVVLNIPIYDVIYHFRNDKVCNPDDKQYDWQKCLEGEVFEHVTPRYTPDPGYNGKYYYHIIGIAAFMPTKKGTQGGDKYLEGEFIAWVNPSAKGQITCPDPCVNENFFGVAIVKLTK